MSPNLILEKILTTLLHLYILYIYSMINMHAEETAYEHSNIQLVSGAYL